jgi:DNA-binding response OmpR family regulator
MKGDNNQKKVLIADDDDQFAMMIQNALEQSGFSVIRAVDGDQGLAFAKSENPDFVLLDIMMPKRLGFEVLEEIKADEKTKDIPVITISHLSQPSDIEKAKKLGAVDHFVKTNFSIRDLTEKIKENIR